MSFEICYSSSLILLQTESLSRKGTYLQSEEHLASHNDSLQSANSTAASKQQHPLQMQQQQQQQQPKPPAPLLPSTGNHPAPEAIYDAPGAPGTPGGLLQQQQQPHLLMSKDQHLVDTMGKIPRN